MPMQKISEEFQENAATVALPRHPVIHLAIDVQERFAYGLTEEREKSYPRQIEGFCADMRRENIPTVHVGFGWGRPQEVTVAHIARRAAWSITVPKKCLQHPDVDALGFRVRPRVDEDVFVKYLDCAFDKGKQPGLDDLLNQYQAHTVVLTGGNTRYCVKSSARGALVAGFNVVLVYDRMADACSNNVDEDPAWHRRQLESSFSDMLGGGAKSGLPSVALLTAREARAFAAAQNNPK